LSHSAKKAFSIKQGLPKYEGAKLKLNDQWYDILLILVRCRGRKVKVDELIGAVWPEEKVTQRMDNLYVDIAELKKVLRGATPEAFEFIRNYRRQGYRFESDVKEHEVPTTICILPFKSDGKGQVADEIGLEFADTLASLLSENILIRVTPLATIIKEYSEHPKQAARDFGHRLVVDYVLSGSIWRQTHEHLHVTVELLNVRAGKAIASHSFDGYDESFELRKDIHQWMQSVLELSTTDRAMVQATKWNTKNQKARKYFRRGRVQRYKGTEISFKRAIIYFRKATEEDAEFARAYANLADTYLFMGMLNLISSEDSYEGAKRSRDQGAGEGRHHGKRSHGVGVHQDVF
jgi:DNA-binding winged helix-turn-helix (wHTH) protein